MKKNKTKAKKGMTLIEVIISVALLSILLVPISGLVMSSLKNNKKSEYKQQATYVGQKVLEELKAYDEIKLEGANEKYFILLDGDEIKQTSENEFQGDLKRTIYGSTSETQSRNEETYNVEVTMTKDSSFKYSDTNNLNKNNDADFKLNFLRKDNINKIQLDSSENTNSTVNGDLIIELNKGPSNLTLEVYEKNNSIPIITGQKEINNNSRSIILYLEKIYTNNTNIEIKNNTGDYIDIHLIKQDKATGKLNLTSSKGNVILYEEDEIETNPIGDMYKYAITVKDDDNNILFKGSSSKNVNIK